MDLNRHRFGLGDRLCIRCDVTGYAFPGRQSTSCLQHRIGDRADVRVNALEVAEDVEVQRGRLESFRAAFAQALEVAIRRFQLRLTQVALFAQQAARRRDAEVMKIPKAA